MQFKAFKFFLEGSAPKDPCWGEEAEHPKTPSYIWESSNACILTIFAFPIGAWQPQL